MERILTLKEAQGVFQAVAALSDVIAFRWLVEGCECRAQLMIEHLQALGIKPGRAWAVAVGRLLSLPEPDNPHRSYKWHNHVAPTVPVGGVDYGVMVIDPALSPAGPLTLAEWARTMRARSIEVSDIGLSQAEILSRQAAQALKGQDLDAMVFYLKYGEAPIPEIGGTGFRIDPEPAEGISAFAHEMMQEYLAYQKARERRRP
jgi:hypothetical protein